MFIREASKSAYFSHDVLGGRMGIGQRPQKITMPKALLVAEHAFARMDVMEQQGRAA